MSQFAVTVLFSGLLCASPVFAQTAVKSWAITNAPEHLRPTISRADLLIIEVQSSHLRQLKRQLAEGGPPLAFSVCHMEPAAFANRVSRFGIKTGFTSDRLRNPRNAPAPWAAAFVAANAGRRARDVDGFVVDLGSTVGVLRPMVEQRTCASCHGPVRRISPAVRQLIAERYPADRAVGFSNGEIRGWFWVEIPKRGR